MPKSRHHKVRSSDHIRRRLKSDLVNFLSEERDRFSGGVREARYRLLQSAAYAVEWLLEDKKAFSKLLQEPFFENVHVKPKEPGLAVIQFLTNALTEPDRQRANRAGRAVQNLLAHGTEPGEIAKRLSKKGGVAGALGLGSSGDSADEEDEAQEATQDAHSDSEEDRDRASSSKSTTLRVPRPPTGYFYVYLLAEENDRDNVLRLGHHQRGYDVSALDSSEFVQAMADAHSADEDDSDDGS